MDVVSAVMPLVVAASNRPTSFGSAKMPLDTSIMSVIL